MFLIGACWIILPFYSATLEEVYITFHSGITMKKLAEVLCVPFTMARSFIRYFDTNKLGRMINVDHLKLKLHKIVAIQYLHESETVQKIKSNRLRIEQHKSAQMDAKPDVEQVEEVIGEWVSP